MAEIPHVEKPVCDYAKKRGLFVRKCIWHGRNGAPDRLFFGRGMHFFIEFKEKGIEPELHQLREHDRLRQGGFDVYVIDDPTEGIALIDRLLDARGPVSTPRAPRSRVAASPRAKLARALGLDWPVSVPRPAEPPGTPDDEDDLSGLI